MRHALASIAILGIALQACDGGAGGASDASTDTTPASDAAQNDAAPAEGGDASNPTDAGDGGVAAPVSLTMGPFTPGAGVESTKCATMQLSNAGPVHIGAIHTVLTGSWHDLIVYRVDDKNPSPPADCAPLEGLFAANAGTALTFTQRDDELLQLPAGDGFTFADHQMIRLELHGVDDGSGFGATVTFDPIADSSFQRETGMLLVGFVDISLPVGVDTILHQQAPAPAIALGSDLLVMSGHQHALGTELSVGSIYDSTSWNDPPVTTLTPVAVTSGTKIDTTCKWHNGTSSTVTYGAGAQQEQCFVRAHFAPATGSRTCVHSEKSGTFDVCCPGDTLCSSL